VAWCGPARGQHRGADRTHEDLEVAGAEPARWERATEATAQACGGGAAVAPRASSLAGKRHGWAGLRRAGGMTRPGGARRRWCCSVDPLVPPARAAAEGAALMRADLGPRGGGGAVMAR
jgi:hypothetical protein